MRHYVEANMNEKSVTTTKYTMKMMANISETVIFMFLGLSTVVDTLDWQWDFIFFAILFCITYRIVGEFRGLKTEGHWDSFSSGAVDRETTVI